MVTIYRTYLNHAAGSVVCDCREAVKAAGGTRFLDGSVTLNTSVAPMDKPDWTDADVCEAVGNLLGIPSGDVCIEARPEPAEPAE